ncbi:MAG TPA: hypothetical protein VIC30_12160, partial [Orrella sp.]
MHKGELGAVGDVGEAMDLGRDAANFLPLTPLNFLDRASQVYPERVALIHGDLRQTWRQTDQRCRQLASAL